MPSKNALFSLALGVVSWVFLGSLLLHPLVGVYPLAWGAIGAAFYASWYFDRPFPHQNEDS